MFATGIRETEPSGGGPVGIHIGSHLFSSRILCPDSVLLNSASSVLGTVITSSIPICEYEYYLVFSMVRCFSCPKQSQTAYLILFSTKIGRESLKTNIAENKAIGLT